MQTLREADLLSLLRDALKNKVFCRRILLHTLLYALLLWVTFGGRVAPSAGKKLDTLNHSES